MAGLASKLVPILPAISNNVSAPSKLLAVQAINSKVNKANMHSKTSGLCPERSKPWNYERLGYNLFWQHFDGTTKRFNDNTKIIVVEGPPGLEKGKFAKELADEFDMEYVPCITMDSWYINKYGYDLRDLDHHFKYPCNVSFDEKKFAQDPTSQDGGLDRMQQLLLIQRAKSYHDILKNLFNSGRGFVTEKSPHSDHIWVEVALKMGWIHKTSKNFMDRQRVQLLQKLLRPNIIIYLDAPIDVVQEKQRERGETTHPWLKNSPVFNNTEYLKMVYEDGFKNDYLNKASAYSKVLTYDWSEGGDTEVVVEDIERLNLDYFDKYDKQQSDWRMFKEDMYCAHRTLYTLGQWYGNALKHQYWEADKIIPTAEESMDWEEVAHKLPGNYFAYGHNEEMGDKIPLFNPKQLRYREQSSAYYIDNNSRHTLEFEAYWRERTRRRLAGEANWWNFQM